MRRRIDLLAITITMHTHIQIMSFIYDIYTKRCDVEANMHCSLIVTQSLTHNATTTKRAAVKERGLCDERVVRGIRGCINVKTKAMEH